MPPAATSRAANHRSQRGRCARPNNGRRSGRFTASVSPSGNISSKLGDREPRFKNDYKGFHPPSSRWTPERVAVGSISPEDFYRRYVVTRTPCVLVTSGEPSAANRLLGKTPPRWSLEELHKRAGHVTVEVEKKAEHGSFGEGRPREKMLFGDLLDAFVKQGRTDLYMTTQYQNDAQSDSERDLDKDNTEAELRWKAREYCQAPLFALLGDFEMRPPLFGKLVPQQVNLWFGCVSLFDDKGTSSGLHHDFHDNLYILLRGRKRFTIFSPLDARHMYVYGQLSRVHANGLINYRNAETRSDGANPVDAARWRVKMAKQRLAAMEAAARDEGPAEEELEEAMDALLDAEFVDGKWFGEQQSDESLGSRKKVKQRRGAGRTVVPKRKPVAEVADARTSEPPSFSKIPAAVLHSPDLLGQYPLFGGATRITCELHEGEILYLPASWFHEVTSYGYCADAGGLQAVGAIHMAFNYWLAPPTTTDLARPYEDDHWESQWAEIENAIWEGCLSKLSDSKGGRFKPTCAGEVTHPDKPSSARIIPHAYPMQSSSRMRHARKRKLPSKPGWIVKDA